MFRVNVSHMLTRPCTHPRVFVCVCVCAVGRYMRNMYFHVKVSETVCVFYFHVCLSVLSLVCVCV